jgi:hypothetical protein
MLMLPLLAVYHWSLRYKRDDRPVEAAQEATHKG